jgi:integrin beta 8
VLSGPVTPTSEGADGDFYIDTVAHLIYGPKTAGAWGAGTSLVGPRGDAGDAGADGTDGVDGASPFTLSGDDAYYTAGNVGIGTTTPQTALHVNGEATFEDAVTFNGPLYLQPQGDIPMFTAP